MSTRIIDDDEQRSPTYSCIFISATTASSSQTLSDLSHVFPFHHISQSSYAMEKQNCQQKKRTKLYYKC